MEYVRQKTDRKMNLLKLLSSLYDLNAGIIYNTYTATIQSTHNHGKPLNLGVPSGTSARIIRNELQMIHMEHRAKLSRAKLFRKNRGNTNHIYHITLNRRQINECTLRYRGVTDSQQNNRRSQQIDDSVLREHLPYECRIYWIREGTDILKKRSETYIRSQQDNTTH